MTNVTVKVLKNIFLLLLLLISLHSFSQDQEKSEITNVTRVSFFSPGISYEKKIGKLQTLCARAFMSTSFYFFYSSSLGTTAGIDLYPSWSLQYRYYYNSAMRNAKGKRAEMNSLNYVSAIAEMVFFKETVSSNGDTDLRSLNSFGIVWGISRNYQKRFSLDLSVGPGYVYAKRTTLNEFGEYITENKGGITLVGQISLGFWLNKRK
jgi:hypothetical protein